MPEDRSSGTDPTLTPSQAPSEGSHLATSATETDVPRSQAPGGALPTRYALGPLLGAGGMGEVLLATDTQIERDVAIKRMRTSPTPSAIARFTREAKIQGRLDHPAIVPVHELAIDTEGRPFFVMKRLTGTTLAEILEPRDGGQARPRQKLLRAFADVCLAIEFAHARGVIHRDLKPANIMLGDYGEVYVLDWGVARLLDSHDDTADARPGEPEAAGHTETGAILGTPGYIAPELLRGERLDGRADVYALGCILFEILAGQPLLPRGRAALQAALEDIDARPSVRTPDADIPPELDQLCVEATTCDRAKRPRARELAERIERYLDGDRDLALRRTVAVSHVDAARTAIAAGDGPQERARAMREAGTAIALDPHNRDAAALIAKLMLDPPKEIPPEVDARVEQIAQHTGREKLQMVMQAELFFLLFIPAILLVGLRSTAAFTALVVSMGINIASTYWYTRQQRVPSLRDIYISAIIYAAFIGILARVFTPFLLAPAIAAVSVTMFAMDARLRWVPLSLGYIVVVLAPWLLELTGLASDTMLAVGGDLVLHFDIASIRTPQAEIALAVFATVLIGLSAYMASQLAAAHRRAVRSVELQAWHLRQLVNG